MLNSGKKIELCATKKNNILTLVFEKKILNETKNHNPPSLQVKWSVPNPFGRFRLFLSLSSIDILTWGRY